MKLIAIIGATLALLTYLPLWKQIISGAAKQNLLTWILWATLDGVAAATLIVQRGNFLLPAVYVGGSAITALIIYWHRGEAKWTRFESMVLLMFFISMVIWYSSGSKVATIASTAAMVIAGFPQIIDTFKRPKEVPRLVYLSYFSANLLSAAGGADWSIKERFYPICAAGLCLTIFLLTLRKTKN